MNIFFFFFSWLRLLFLLVGNLFKMVSSQIIYTIKANYTSVPRCSAVSRDWGNTEMENLERRRGGFSIRHECHSKVLFFTLWILCRWSSSWSCISTTTSSATSITSSSSTTTIASIPTTHCTAEHLHHSHRVLATTSSASSAHSADVLSLWQDSQLSTLEQWLVQVLGFNRALFISELDVGLPIQITSQKFEI